MMPDSWMGYGEEDLRLIRKGRKEARKLAMEKARIRKRRVKELVSLNDPNRLPRAIERYRKKQERLKSN